MSRILVVDEEPADCEAVTRALQADGAQVSCVRDASGAMGALNGGGYDLVIIDIAPPHVGGFETLRAIRERSDVPIIVATGAGGLKERLTGFDLGADDYLVKPVQVPELVRRVRAVLRRCAERAEHRDVLEGPGGVSLRLRSREAYVRDRPVHLTPMEFAVLHALLERRGSVITPDELAEGIWGHETFGSRNFVEAHISRLRAKLRRAGAEQVISTVRGVGYVIR